MASKRCGVGIYLSRLLRCQPPTPHNLDEGAGAFYGREAEALNFPRGLARIFLHPHGVDCAARL